MRKSILLVTLASAMALGGCNMFGADGDSAEKGVDPTKAMANAPQVEPGQYEASMEIVKLEIPGMPPEIQTKMREQMASVTGVQNRYCVTAEQARRGREDMARQMANAPGNCPGGRASTAGTKAVVRARAAAAAKASERSDIFCSLSQSETLIVGERGE